MLKFDAYQNLERLRKPVDKDKWATEPAVVNAFYNPNKNHIGNIQTITLYQIMTEFTYIIIYNYLILIFLSQ